MTNYYTNEKDILELVALIKAHGIKRAVVSPGSTNISFAASLLYDQDIEVYSSVDERSAAYMACGLSEETGEPVILSCTGATASRNYAPGLTEAYYRKLPILVVTSSQFFGRVGHLMPQVTDRTSPMKDMVVKSVQIPISHTKEEKWSNNIKINDALLELSRKGGGPVHINIETSFSKVFDVKELPQTRVVKRIEIWNRFPEIDAKKIAIFVGSHSVFSKELTKEIDLFCQKYNAIVICDHTSNFKGQFRVQGGIIERQAGYQSPCIKPDLLIHIGEMSGAYYQLKNLPTWRVNPDGEIRDTFKKLEYVFEMPEFAFFQYFNKNVKTPKVNTYIDEWNKEEERLLNELPELSFSNAWIAQQTSKRLPPHSEIHFGILNSLRMWNLFPIPESVYGYSNVGGFGIDGCISSTLGASIANREKLFFLVLGDLATFYDLNTLGNRHFGNNVRIIVINNGTGFEMRHKTNRGDVFKEDANILFAAGGHFGNQSRNLLKHFATDLGFEYLTASNKEEYLSQLDHFLANEMLEKPILFEVFVKVEDEYKDFELTQYVIQDPSVAAKNKIKNILGEKGVQTIKKIKNYTVGK